MTLLSRWMKFGLMSASLTAAPLQSALAFAPQWRPALPIAPIQPIQPLKPIAPIATTDQRFRPVAMSSQIAMPARRFTPVAAVKPQHIQQTNVAPTFARQYAWRPAAQNWMPHAQVQMQQPQQPQRYRLVRRVIQPMPQQMLRPAYPQQGNWRPVQTVTTPQGRFALRPVAVRGMFRPAPQYRYAPQPVARQLYRPVARMMPVSQMRPMPFAQPWANRFAYPQQWAHWQQAMPYTARQMPRSAAMPQRRFRTISSNMQANASQGKFRPVNLPRWMTTQSPTLACGNCDY